MPLTLSGDLSDTPFSDIVSLLRLKHATGTLTCTARDVERQVHLKDGTIIFAMSQDERDRLGEVMVRMGKLTRIQLNKALDLHRKSVGLKKIGAIFVEQGYVGPKDLFNGLKFQVRSIISRLFMMTDGSYEFVESMPPDVIPLQIDMEELLHEVIQQMKQQDR